MTRKVLQALLKDIPDEAEIDIDIGLEDHSNRYSIEMYRIEQKYDQDGFLNETTVSLG